MILNISRARQFLSCQRYAYNWDELHLTPNREEDPLVIGEGYHLGSEIISQTADVAKAIEAVETRMRERYAGSMVLPEEIPNIERNIEWAKQATAAWAENYDKAEFRVLWPEVAGQVALPGTEHHCFFAHRILFPTVPFDQCTETRCHIPHYLAFRTDGVIEMYKHIWLLEQKTTSSTQRNHFWEKFQLNIQVRGYAYGVWKTTGVLVNGVLINAIIKHHKQKTVNGVREYQLDPTNVGFEREPIIITMDDINDFEKDFIAVAERYEHVFRTQSMLKNTDACFNYNRRCYYFDMCKRGYEALDGEFKQRNPDYVEQAYDKILGLTPKESPANETEKV